MHNSYISIYIYIWYPPPPPPLPRSASLLRSMNTKTWVQEGGGRQWKVVGLPTYSMISHGQIMENVGCTNLSNNFHDFPNYGSGPRGSRNSWKLLVLPTFSMLSHRQIMENVGLTNISNNFHDLPNFCSGSRGFSKFIGIVRFTTVFHAFPQTNHGKHDLSKLWLWPTRFLEIHGYC